MLDGFIRLAAASAAALCLGACDPMSFLKKEEWKTQEADIDVKGSAWTLMEDGRPVVYRKD